MYATCGTTLSTTLVPLQHCVCLPKNSANMRTLFPLFAFACRKDTAPDTSLLTIYCSLYARGVTSLSKQWETSGKNVRKRFIYGRHCEAVVCLPLPSVLRRLREISRRNVLAPPDQRGPHVRVLQLLAHSELVFRSLRPHLYTPSSAACGQRTLARRSSHHRLQASRASTCTRGGVVGANGCMLSKTAFTSTG